MSNPDPDVVVIGAGPNGLVAACMLAKHGFRVSLFEANARRPGGAVASEQLTQPGFVHDIGAGFFPFGRSSPAFVELNLEGQGLAWKNARFETCHPALDGSYAAIARDLDLSAQHFGSERDGARWRKLCGFHARIEERLLDLLMGPFPTLGPALGMGLFDLIRIMSMFASSGRGLSARLFESEAARRVLPSLALHVAVGPDDWFGAGLAYMLGLTATTGGYAVPVGGAQRITDSLVTTFERHGGKLYLGAPVSRVLVRGRRAVGVEVDGLGEVKARRAVVANTAAPTLLLDLVDQALLPGRVVHKMRRFPYAGGTFKLDWALSGPIPWSAEVARESAVVHTGESVDDLSRYVREIRSGSLPELPYLVLGQHSLVDDTRAPAGCHTLYCYSRVPSEVDGGWAKHREAFADRIEERIEALAPGFRALVLGRSITTPPDLEKMNANLVGGDLGGGSNAWNRQLLFRPVFPYFRYKMPIDALYLSSSYAHPGAGVHGMCGYNAAKRVVRDLG